MIRRCYEETHCAYRWYGYRGIKVCDEWRHNFWQFVKDMGPKPRPRRKYTLDRIDNDKDYSPENCRWATWKEQFASKRKRRTKKEIEMEKL